MKNKKEKKVVSAESNKTRQVIKLPPGFKKFITDKNIRKEFINFARKKDQRPSMSELVSHCDSYMTKIDGKVTNEDDISLNTYKLMRKDAQLQLGLKAIKYPIKGMRWWVVCQDKNIQAFVTFALKKVWTSIMNVMLNGLDFGWSASEKIWEVKDIQVERRDGEDMVSAYKGQAVLLKKLKDPDPAQVTILADDNGNFLGFEQTPNCGGTVTVPAEKSFIFTNEKEFGNLYGKSLLRYSYDYWYWATLMYQFLNRYFERRGTPPVIARAPAGRTNLSNGTIIDNLVLAQRAGESLTQSSVVALPSSLHEGEDVPKWNLEYLKDDQRADMFMSYIDHLNAMKLRGLFVPERMVVQDSEMGAKAVASTHLDVFLMGLEGLTRDVVDHINKYIVEQLVKYNFGENAPPAYIETSGLGKESKNLLKQIIISIIKKGGVVPVDMMKALEELNIPIGEMPKPPEEIVSDDEDDDESDLEHKGDKNGKNKNEETINNSRKINKLSDVRRLLESD